MKAGLALLLLLLPAMALAGPPPIESWARVLDDASLSLGGTHVRLAGIEVPKLGLQCIQDWRGSSCSDFSPARALDRRISGFVRCDLVSTDPDGVPRGFCSIQGRDPFGPRLDLGAWLVNEGLAVVLPGAPANYLPLQEVAKARRAGIWSGSLVPLLPGDRGSSGSFPGYP